MAWFDYLERILVGLTPIIVAYLAYRTSKREKADKDYRELRQKYEKELEKKRNDEEAERKRDMENIQEDIESFKDDIKMDIQNITAQMDALKEQIDMSEITKQLNNLVDITGINLDYSQSLSKVLLTIGSALCNESNPHCEDITKVMNEHQEKERNIVNKIYKAIY